ncbi:MAG TPA: DISARM system phospholipase D-like protein DrmC [Gemmataceae bacterium]
MEALHHLSDADLAALAAALRSGRLTSPYTTAAVGRFCPAAHAEEVGASLRGADQTGMRPEHLAVLAEAVARARRGRSDPAGTIDLVWTGPETGGVANRDTGVVLRELFRAAESEVLVAGFVVYQGREVFRELAARMADRPAMRVRLFLNVPRHPADTSLDSEVLRRFAARFRSREWPGDRLPEVFHDPRSLATDPAERASLHAKCVVIDRRVAFVTSANFTGAAQTRNIEAGVLVRSEAFAAKLAEHFDALVEAGALKPIPFNNRKNRGGGLY